MKKNLFLMMFVTALLMSSSAFAQARMYGKVLDPEGKPVQGAKVTLSSERGGTMSPIKTDKRGEWASILPIGGTWNIDVEAEGFLKSLGTLEVSEVSRNPKVKTVLEPRPQPKPQPEPEQQVQEQLAPTVPQEAIDAVRMAEALMRRAENKLQPDDLSVLGLTEMPAAPSKDERKALYEAAIVELQKAHAILPDHLELKKALARAYYAAGQLEPAIGLLEDVHRAEPANQGITMLLVNILLEAGKLDRGIAMLNNLPQESMKDPTALINVGILFLNKEKAEEARKWFDRAVAVDPSRGESYYYRGIAALQLKDMKSSKNDLQKVIELAPESSEASDAKDLLKQMG